MTAYAAMQGGGKAHRIVEGGRASLCGIDLSGDHILFDAELVRAEERCLRCWRATPPDTTVDEVVAALIDTEIARAVDCYTHAMPGHGEYLLVRLGMKLARLEQAVAEARDLLDRT